MKGSLFKILTFFFAACLVYGCNRSNSKKTKDEGYYFDLKEIKERGKLIALTRTSSTSYFIYKGIPMGYDYELLRLFCEHIGVDLEIVVVKDMDEVFALLNNGAGDIIAANLTETKERNKFVDFCEYHLLTRQMLVQRMPENWLNLPAHSIEKLLTRNLINLAGKTIHVRKGTSYYERLVNLSNEIGSSINIAIVPGDSATEQLIEGVSNGKIDYTVADENIAKMNEKYFDNIDVKTAISFPQKIAWAVRKNSPELKIAINDWIVSNRKNNDYITIYNKYFRSSRTHKNRVKSEYSSISGNKISEFDDIIKEHSEIVNWDWLLFASMIYQESKFDPEAKSWTGAFGLMQLLPQTAENFGIGDTTDPVENIRVSTLYLARLISYWEDKITDENERIKFVLASYNVGLGHVIDARRLAEKYKKDADLWEGNVAEMLLLKAQEKYFNDDVVKHGYCRGSEPYKYVKEILERYEHYKNILDV